MQSHYKAVLEDRGSMGTQAHSQAMTGAQIKEVDTRFGRVSINLANAIHFPKGLVGMPDKTDFCLTSFPNEKLARFKLMQSASDDDLAFITLPIDAENEFVDQEDVSMACQMLGIPAQDVAMLLIVSVHRGVGGVRLSVNCVAPVFIDSARKTATQFVFAHTKYRVRTML